MRALVTSAVLLCCALGAAAQPRASIANGQSVYMRVGCFTCHGTVGHGGAAPRLAPNTLPLEGFTAWVRNGTPGWTIATGMPAFSTDVLSDAELADVRAYLASLPPPRAVADIPLLAP
jgi:ubiquinol-cytochrome c reductase cytochrome c subunit